MKSIFKNALVYVCVYSDLCFLIVLVTTSKDMLDFYMFIA